MLDPCFQVNVIFKQPLKRDPKGVLEERYPGVSELVAARGLDLDEMLKMWGFTYWSVEKAKRGLGYRPEHNFSEFYDALKEGDEGYYPFANLPWWGGVLKTLSEACILMVIGS